MSQIEKARYIDSTFDIVYVDSYSTQVGLMRCNNTRVQRICFTSLYVPVDKMPPEIMSHIFRLLVPLVTSHIPIPTLEDWLETLDIFTNVNTYWRTIATSDPVLWSRLDLDIRNRSTRLPIPILRRWLQNMPMDNLDLHINTPYLTESTEQIYNLYKEVDRSSRLVHLQIHIRHTFPHYHLAILSGIELPNLGSLTIRENEFKSSFPNQLRVTLKAPRLQTLTLDSAQPRSIPHRDTLQHITKLNMDLHTNHLYTYHNILTACPLLAECSIAIRQPILRIVENTPENTITLSHLTTLSIEVTPPMLSLLDIMCTPGLQVLNISMHLGSKVKADSLLPFISKSPTLVHIDLTGINVMEDEKQFEHNIRSIHPDVFIDWKNAKRIPRIIYREKYISGSDTELEFTEDVLQWEEILWETDGGNA